MFSKAFLIASVTFGLLVATSPLQQDQQQRRGVIVLPKRSSLTTPNGSFDYDKPLL
ncbi:hypothetical protein GYMLUDRAFT_829683 [Collybiopsis luxurians FD-317 M1]|uniref:Uncharacterized protein n=1 Tax=Collybiopsis luxurians FD-317 M1 TaxID=944289 RepID=A0A0D0C118_9AGAR|nr:hypothetical protein GYMLUDRAFT_829683 [Collybiopsis luxurians FD-317 M1]